MNDDITPRQRQYLAFIAQYSELAQVAPSEGDIADYFGVSGPSAHQMVVTLETKALLFRFPGLARSIRLRVSRYVLPVVGAPGETATTRHAGMAAFAVYLARRLAKSNVHSFSRFASILRLSIQLEESLRTAGASPRFVKQATKAVMRVARELVPRTRKPEEAASSAGGLHTSAPAPAPKRPRRETPPEQGSLF